MTPSPSFRYESRKARLALNRPAAVFAARAIDEVRPALEAADAAVAQGKTAAGFIAYEAAPAFDPALQCHPPAELPLVWIAVFDETDATAPESQSHFTFGEWRTSIGKPDYLAALDRIKQWIAAGDTYQVNYTYPLDATFEGDPYAAYGALCAAQGVGHTAYVDAGRYRIVSASPELFFRLDDGVVTAQPMKGTRVRGLWSAQDEAFAEDLRHSEKDCAENVMIVDMIRNDLGRIADPGTVSVKALFDVAQYPTVWQMTSTIEARTPRSVPEIIAAMFPCASVTGAPKVQTMRRIRELEPEPRGAYCGAIGWWRPDGTAEFNVAIRTLTIDSEKGTARYHVGSGVTWDSDPREEFDECGAKAAILHHAEPQFDLLESLLFDGAYFLLNDHLDRLAATARYFNFPVDLDRIRGALLDSAAKWHGAPYKVRLLVSRSGHVHVEGAPIAALSPVTIEIADTPVNSRDRFLYHKTTNRGVYDRALASRPDCGDVLLINERGELTESTRANLVVKLGDALYTPPVECGLLAGVMRNRLLADRRIQERVLCPHDLDGADGVWLINSVRKWIDVDFSPTRRTETPQPAPADAT